MLSASIFSSPIYNRKWELYFHKHLVSASLLAIAMNRSCSFRFSSLSKFSWLSISSGVPHAVRRSRQPLALFHHRKHFSLWSLASIVKDKGFIPSSYYEHSLLMMSRSSNPLSLQHYH
jgi:hypothetical protein